MKLAPLLACAAFTTAPAFAAEEPRPSLAEVMDGATAMATIAPYLFVTKQDSSWVCAINVTSKHFAALIEGDDVVADQTVPGAICVPAAHFENLAE